MINRKRAIKCRIDKIICSVKIIKFSESIALDTNDCLRVMILMQCNVLVIRYLWGWRVSLVRHSEVTAVRVPVCAFHSLQKSCMHLVKIMYSSLSSKILNFTMIKKNLRILSMLTIVKTTLPKKIFLTQSQIRRAATQLLHVTPPLRNCYTSLHRYVTTTRHCYVTTTRHCYAISTRHCYAYATATRHCYVYATDHCYDVPKGYTTLYRYPTYLS